MRRELLSKRAKIVKGYNKRRSQRSRSNRISRNAKNRFCSIARSVRRNNARKAAIDRASMRNLRNKLGKDLRTLKKLEFLKGMLKHYGAPTHHIQYQIDTIRRIINASLRSLRREHAKKASIRRKAQYYANKKCSHARRRYRRRVARNRRKGASDRRSVRKSLKIIKDDLAAIAAVEAKARGRSISGRTKNSIGYTSKGTKNAVNKMVNRIGGDNNKRIRALKSRIHRRVASRTRQNNRVKSDKRKTCNEARHIQKENNKERLDDRKESSDLNKKLTKDLAIVKKLEFLKGLLKRYGAPITHIQTQLNKIKAAIRSERNALRKAHRKSEVARKREESKAWRKCKAARATYSRVYRKNQALNRVDNKRLRKAINTHVEDMKELKSMQRMMSSFDGGKSAKYSGLLVTKCSRGQRGKNINHGYIRHGHAYTYSFWLNPMGRRNTRHWRSLFHRGSTNYRRNPAIWLSPRHNNIAIVTGTTASWNEHFYTRILPRSSWTHVVFMTIRYGRRWYQRIYLNGRHYATRKLRGTPLVAPPREPLYVSDPWYHIPRNDRVKIADLRIISGSASARQVRYLYSMKGYRNC